MRAVICTINVGGEEGNRNMVIDVLFLVDIFIFVDGAVRIDGEFVEHESEKYELISFVKGSGVEVFVKRGLVGWVEVEEHDEWMVVLKGKERDDEGVMRSVRIGGVYLRPDRGVAEVNLGKGKLERCDVIIGDFNARNPRWGTKSEDTTMNVYGR